MDSNQKKFNMYVFFSTFARNLIEVFLGTILYKAGFSVHEVIFYYLMVHLFSLIFAYPCVKFSKVFSNKILSFIGIGAFIIQQILLNTIIVNKAYLILLSFLYALYRRCYWVARRYYNLKVIKKDNIASNYSIISIVNQISVIVAAYIGSLLLEFVSIRMLTVISITIFICSVFSLYGLKFQYEKNNEKIDLIGTIKQIPKSTLYLFGSYELLTVVKFFIPIYIYIYIQDSYHTIGLLTLISNVATIIITYLYGKKINKDKNYYKGTLVMVALIFIAKVNVGAKLIFLISFLEGVFCKMLELSVNKEFFTLSKKFEYYNYNLVYEVIQNIFRVTVVGLIYLFVFDLKNMVYVTLLFMLIGVFLKFKSVEKIDFEIKEN